MAGDENISAVSGCDTDLRQAFTGNCLKFLFSDLIDTMRYVTQVNSPVFARCQAECRLYVFFESKAHILE